MSYTEGEEVMLLFVSNVAGDRMFQLRLTRTDDCQLWTVCVIIRLCLNSNNHIIKLFSVVHQGNLLPEQYRRCSCRND